MRVAPEIFDTGKESPKTLELYGVRPGDTKSFGYQCLMARRFLERGVRVVELIESGSDGDANWDAHSNIKKQITRKTERIDAPLAEHCQRIPQSRLCQGKFISDDRIRDLGD
jgi:Protein of unknown function (DUF1501)